MEINSVGNGILKEGDYLDYTPIPLTMVGDTDTVGNHRHVKKRISPKLLQKDYITMKL